MALVLRVVIVVAWFSTLTIGLKVNAAECQNTVIGLALFVIASTSTNVGILAVLSSMLCPTTHIGDSIRRGFTIYLMLISGVIVVFTDSIANPTPAQYAKIAGMVSLSCLVASYKPEVFQSFLDRVAIAIVGADPNKQ